MTTSYQNLEANIKGTDVSSEEQPLTSSSTVSTSKIALAALATLGFMASIGLSVRESVQNFKPETTVTSQFEDLSVVRFFLSGEDSTKSIEGKVFSLARDGPKHTNCLTVLRDSGMNCVDRALGSFAFHDENREDGDAWWGAKCNKMIELGEGNIVTKINIESEPTPAVENEADGIMYLDRQNLECPENTFMSALELKQSEVNKIYWTSTCVSYSQATQVDCEVVSSEYQDPGYAIIFLDRHPVQCPAGKALKGFGGQSKDGNFQFKATCCSATAVKTNAPVATPTMSPTKTVYKDPIISAMYAVRQEGLLKEKHAKCKETSNGELADMEMAITQCGCIEGQDRKDMSNVANFWQDPAANAYCQCNDIQLTQNEPSGKAVGKDFVISGSEFGGHLYFLLKPLYKDYKDVACTSPEDMVEEIPPALYCPVSFSYPKYDSKFVPNGCTLISTADLGWDLLEVDTQGIYACSSRHTKAVRLDGNMLKNFNLITKSKSLISYVNPADDVSAEFFSEKFFTGKTAIFRKDPQNNIVNFRFPGDKEVANDNVFSIILSSTAEKIPEDCDALEKLVKGKRPNIPGEHSGLKEEGVDQDSVDVGPEGIDHDQNPDGREGAIDEKFSGEDEAKARIAAENLYKQNMAAVEKAIVDAAEKRR